jgi:hypothetical protein
VAESGVALRFTEWKLISLSTAPFCPLQKHHVNVVREGYSHPRIYEKF